MLQRGGKLVIRKMAKKKKKEKNIHKLQENQKYMCI